MKVLRVRWNTSAMWKQRSAKCCWPIPPYEQRSAMTSFIGSEYSSIPSMSRSERARMAEETVRIIRAGEYTSAEGRAVSIASAVAKCVAETRLLSAEETERLRALGPQRGALTGPAVVEVTSEPTIMAILRLRSLDHLGVLNFASARNPGGGFLGGSQAQEESLARSSALYESLLSVPEYYERHRRMRSLLYSDAMIVSPACPVIRDDDGTLLNEPVAVTFITSPAPNAGAIAENQPEDLPQAGCRNLILGAWGCGVFRNEPSTVAAVFARQLARGGRWAQQFERVAFAVLDRSSTQENYRAFERAYNR
jgi:uncharacterized protein (TIGR02452 family)